MYENTPATIGHAAHLYKIGRLGEAAQISEMILKDRPGNFEALHLLGVIRYAQRRLPEALALQKAALRVRPESYGAHTHIGLILANLRRYEEAIFSYQRALAIKPKYAEVHWRLGNVFIAVGRYKEAIDGYYRTLAIKPACVRAHGNLGYALKALNRHEEAIHSYQRMLAINSHSAAGHNGLGTVLERVGRYEEAIDSYYRALAIKPDCSGAHNNLGNVFAALGCDKEAIASYNQALAIKPDCADFHKNRAFFALARGVFEIGFREYEWRWATAEGLVAKRSFTQPLWLGGEDIAGKTILLHAEQGLGDTIQFLRYVPLVANMGATVILEVQKGLKTLFGNLKCAQAIFERGEPLPTSDFHCPLMSLPLACRTELVTIPANIPYILPEPVRQVKWARRLPKHERPRIGIAWSGNPKHSGDFERSMPLRKLVPLIQESELDFYVLQKEIRGSDLEDLKSLRSLMNYSDQLNDFADTAALVSLMDLVISVDTSLAHLAGAMGKPTWILLPFATDWRWGRARQDSPWYPTVRLFRQTKACDWASVIETVLLECKKLFVARLSPLSRQDSDLREVCATGAETWYR